MEVLSSLLVLAETVMVEPSLQKVADRVAELLITRKHTVSISESCCGGLISAALLAYPGASAYYRGGHVAYSPHSQKIYFPATLLDDLKAGKVKYGGSQMVQERARGVRAEMDTTWGVAETGQAGPTFIQIKKPEGPYASEGSGIARATIGKATGIFAVAGDESVTGFARSTKLQRESSEGLDFLEI